MKTTLVISSYVAASRVGATASAFCLRRLGIETLVLPTTILGRHPGWGEPGGAALSAEHLRSMWAAIKTQNIPIDAVMTGYLAEDAHIDIALEIITDVRASNPKAIILVDPVMGDNGKLYVPESRAKAITEKLLPVADIITPNVWELSYITQTVTDNFAATLSTASALNTASLVTSVVHGQTIGAIFIDGPTRYYVHHEEFASVPHGGGDSLAATFLAHLLMGELRRDALAKSVASIFSILSAAVSEDAGELPLIREQDALVIAKPLPIEIL